MNIMSLPMSKSQSDDTSSADVEIEIISNENGKNQRKKNDDSNMTNVGTLGSPIVFFSLVLYCLIMCFSHFCFCFVGLHRFVLRLPLTTQLG